MNGKEPGLRWAAILVAALAPTLGGSMAAAQEQVGDTLASYEMEWRTRSQGEVTRRAHAVAELMLERDVGYDGGVKPLMGPKRVMGRWEITFPDAPELHIRYLPDRDELRMLNMDLISSHESAKDVGEEGALEIVKRYLEELDSQDVIALSHYDLASAQFGYVRVGGGDFEGTEDYPYTTEYRITLRRELNGIEMANAGIRFSVHASGRLAGIRFGGVSVNTVVEDGVLRPLGEGRFLTRRLSAEEIEGRFREELRASFKQEPDIAWSRLMYVMPEDVKRAVVEPRHVFAFSLSFPTEEGTVVSRRQIVGYSIMDPQAAAINFTAAAEAQTGQRVTRRR